LLNINDDDKQGRL